MVTAPSSVVLASAVEVVAAFLLLVVVIDRLRSCLGSWSGGGSGGVGDARRKTDGDGMVIVSAMKAYSIHKEKARSRTNSSDEINTIVLQNWGRKYEEV